MKTHPFPTRDFMSQGRQPSMTSQRTSNAAAENGAASAQTASGRTLSLSAGLDRLAREEGT